MNPVFDHIEQNMIAPAEERMPKPATQHTPGPWHLVDNGSYFEIVVPWKSQPQHVDQYCPTICNVSYADNDGIVGKPNARLIAAAPELLAALQAIVADFADSDEIVDEEMRKQIAQARAAIAKAGAA